MHELAIAESLAEVVTARARELDAVRVGSVRLRIGAASGVVPDSLVFCFERLAELEPLLAGARLDIDSVPHRAWCPRCDAGFDVADFVARCPACGAWSDQIIAGTELQIAEMTIVTRDEVEEPADEEGVAPCAP